MTARSDWRAWRTAFFGRYARYALSHYFKRFGAAASGLLAIALMIDLAPQVPPALSGVAWPELGGALMRLAELAALRAADLLPRFFPFACFLGVIWAEAEITLSSARLLVWNGGRTPIQFLAPALWLGLAVAPAQFAFDAQIRPAAMEIQIQTRLGSYGRQFDRAFSAAPHWLHAGNDILKTQFEFDRTELRAPTIYRLNEAGHLVEVDKADSARPSSERGRWTLFHGAAWKNSTMDSVAASMGGRKVEQFQERPIKLAIDPLWIRYWGIYPEYIRLGIVRELAAGAETVDQKQLFLTRLEVDWADGCMPLGMALLAGALVLAVLAHELKPHALLAILLLGFFEQFEMKTFVLMGEHGYVSPFVAAWSPPLSLFAQAGAIVICLAWIGRPGLAERFRDDALTMLRSRLARRGSRGSQRSRG